MSRFSPKGPTTPKLYDVKLCILAITNMKTLLVLLCWVKSDDWEKMATKTEIILYIHPDSFSQRLKIDTKCCHLLAITLYPTKQT